MPILCYPFLKVANLVAYNCNTSYSVASFTSRRLSWDCSTRGDGQTSSFCHDTKCMYTIHVSFAHLPQYTMFDPQILSNHCRKLSSLKMTVIPWRNEKKKRYAKF